MIGFTNPVRKVRLVVAMLLFSAALVIIYLLVTGDSDSWVISCLRLSPPPFFRLWQLVTYSLIHSDSVHLVSNLIILWTGFYLLHHTKRIFIFIFFFAGGITGGLGFLTADTAGSSLIGASNGIAGVIAASLVFPGGRHSNRYGYRLISATILLFALLGVKAPAPVLTGHLCGALAGIIAAVSGKIIKRLGRKHEIPVSGNNKEIIRKIRNSGYESLDSTEKKQI